MNPPAKVLNRFWKRRGQSMTEYTLVIAGVGLVALFTGYRPIANIIVGELNNVIALF